MVPDRDVAAREQRREQGDPRRGGVRWGSADRMLTQAGLDVATVATGLPAASVIITAVLFAMPLLHDPCDPRWRGRRGAHAGGVDRARGVRRPGDRNRLADRIRSTARGDWPRRRPRSELVPPAAWTARDPRFPGPPPPGTRPMLRTLGSRRWQALLGSVGKWVLDYLALLTALAAVGAHPRPSLVLLAYLSGAILGMVPITPGGLGFVEAGLTTMLVLAGSRRATRASPSSRTGSCRTGCRSSQERPRPSLTDGGSLDRLGHRRCRSEAARSESARDAVIGAVMMIAVL